MTLTNRSQTRPLLLLSACLLAAAVQQAQSPAVVKVLGLFERLRAPQFPHLSFELTEDEINAYLKHSLRTAPRPGLESINVKVFPNDYLSTFTIIDFDAVERWKPGTIPVVLRPVLSGKKSVWVDVRFYASNGQGQFSVEKAYFEKIRLPAIFVEKVIEIVAARQPEHYDSTKPVPLPFDLRKIWTHQKSVKGEK